LFDVVFEVTVVIGNGAHLLLVLLQLKLVIVFYGLHVLGVLQILHQLAFDPLNYGLLVLQLRLQVYLLALVLALVLGQLVDLHLRLEDEVLEIVGPMLEVVYLFLLFGVLTQHQLLPVLGTCQLILLLLSDLDLVQLHFGLLLFVEDLVLQFCLAPLLLDLFVLLLQLIDLNHLFLLKLIVSELEILNEGCLFLSHLFILGLENVLEPFVLFVKGKQCFLVLSYLLFFHHGELHLLHLQHFLGLQQ
jgi:hypothetical protein